MADTSCSRGHGAIGKVWAKRPPVSHPMLVKGPWKALSTLPGAHNVTSGYSAVRPSSHMWEKPHQKLWHVRNVRLVSDIGLINVRFLLRGMRNLSLWQCTRGCIKGTTWMTLEKVCSTMGPVRCQKKKTFLKFLTDWIRKLSLLLKGSISKKLIRQQD